MSDLDSVNELIKLGKGDKGRLEHIKNSLDSNKTLFDSDRDYLQQLINEHLSPKSSKPETAEDNKSNKEFCASCGKEISDETSKFCSKCGAGRNNSSSPRLQKPVEWKSESTTLVLAIILGLFGIQGVGHLYVGKIGKGIAYLIGSLVIFGVAIGLIATGIGVIVGGPLLIVYFVMFIFQILDSRKQCRYYNDYLEKNNQRPW